MVFVSSSDQLLLSLFLILCFSNQINNKKAKTCIPYFVLFKLTVLNNLKIRKRILALTLWRKHMSSLSHPLPLTWKRIRPLRLAIWMIHLTRRRQFLHMVLFVMVLKAVMCVTKHHSPLPNVHTQLHTRSDPHFSPPPRLFWKTQHNQNPLSNLPPPPLQQLNRPHLSKPSNTGVTLMTCFQRSAFYLSFCLLL